MRTLDDGANVCDITTTGRRTGHPHTIEIWFVAREATAYILAGSGERSDTVANIRADPRATLRIGPETWEVDGRVVTDPEEAAFVRDRLPAKYAGDEGRLDRWARGALPVAFEVRA